MSSEHIINIVIEYSIVNLHMWTCIQYVCVMYVEFICMEPSQSIYMYINTNIAESAQLSLHIIIMYDIVLLTVLTVYI